MPPLIDGSKSANDEPVCIIGASLAGISCAATLRQLGHQVLIIDRAAFPRAKPCGEGLSASGVAWLQKAGLGDAIRAGQTAHPFYGFEIRSSLNEKVATLRERCAIGYGINRARFDSALLQHLSSNSNVKVMTGHEARVTRDGEFVTVRVDGMNVRSRWLVVADGAASPTSTALAVTSSRSRSERMALTYHVTIRRGRIPDLVQIISSRGREFYVTPTCSADNSERHEVLNITCLWYGSQPRLRREMETDVIPEILAINSLEGVIAQPPRGVSHLMGARRRAHHSWGLIVGDAAEQLDPIGGMGMTHAIASGWLAAQAMHSARSKSTRRPSAFEEYSREREHLARPLRAFTGLTKVALSHGLKIPGFSAVLLSPVSRSIQHATHMAPIAHRTPVGSALGALGAFL